MDLRKVGYDDKDWINFAQNRDWWQAYKVVTNGGQKDKTVVLEGKTSSLRSVRTKPDKTLQDAGITSRPKDKENIPMSNLSEGLIIEVKQEPSSEGSASEKPTPELIDLVSEQDSPEKIVKTSPVPALKKRKLEILKEGGLEVTAIMPPVTSIGSVTITPERRPSVIQHAAPVQNPVLGQVSITVTPDVSHMLGGSPPTESNSAASTPSPTSGCESSTPHRIHDLKHPALQHLYTGSLSQTHSLTPSPSSSNTDEWAPPRVTQSRSIYAHSESTVYGNPKDGIESSSSPSLLYRRRNLIKPVPSGEVLDLRVTNSRKPAVSISRITSVLPQRSAKMPVKSLPKTNGVNPFPIIDGRAMVGSNLEITVVDVPKSSSSSSSSSSLQQRQQQHRTIQQQQQQQQRRSLSIKPSPLNRPLIRNENGKHSSLSITHIPAQRSISSASSSSSQLIIPNPSTAVSSRKNSSNEGSRSRQHQSPSSQPGTPTSSSMSYLPAGSPVFPGYMSGNSSGSSSSKNTSPYHLPLLDPMYYSALYGYPPNVAAAFLSPLQVAASPPIFSPSAEQLQLYKDVYNLRYPQPGGSNFLGLLRDGSTSITPVGQPTPTTK
ncbi:hypothetical protein ANN_22488 [Periplaneta americana]|uniref:Uncharacterized protein n=1 Tax=Periplaneta americana TaxID=6978 RepID=A0ABQ8S8R8_PERAM|nr:hypothetical protein ANN_22488 [Periplaneta americana]